MFNILEDKFKLNILIFAYKVNSVQYEIIIMSDIDT